MTVSKKEKIQEFGWKQIEESGLCCRHCRRFKDGKCTNKLIDQEKVGPDKYNQCIEPSNDVLLPAINKIKKLADSGKLDYSRRMKYARAAIDRYEGATRTMVQSDYKLYSVMEDGSKKSNFNMFMKRGMGFISPYLEPAECAAVTKWLLDDGMYALYEWNPFDRDIEKLKITYLNETGKRQLGKVIYLDGEPYRVIDQERGNLFVVLEVPEEKTQGIDSWFTGSRLEYYLNTDWLAAHPEVEARLIHKVRILTVDNVCDYPGLVPAMPYWVSLMPDDTATKGMGILAEGANMRLEPVGQEHFIRPAFWIAPPDETLSAIKCRIGKQMDKKDNKVQAALAPKAAKAVVRELPPSCISMMLDNFCEAEKAVIGSAIQVSDEEMEVYQMRLETELAEILYLAKLSRKDFDCLLQLRGIVTRPKNK